MPVYEIWKKYGDWKDIETEGRALIKKNLTEAGILKKDAESVAKRPSLFVFYPGVIQDFRKYLILAVKEGKIRLDISQSTQKRGIHIDFINAEPVGFQATKVANSEPKIEPTNNFYVSFDIEEIMKKLETAGNWDEKIDGSITTMCPTL